MKFPGIVLLTCCLLLPEMVFADQSFEMIRITCIRDMRYFEIENKALPGEAVDFVSTGFEEKEKTPGTKKRLALLKKHGLYSPDNLQYECKLPEATYKLKSTKPDASATGECGSGPTASITLTRNDKVWISDVLFGYACFEKPSIERIEINDGKKGWYTQYMTVCFLSNGAGGPDTCKVLGDTYLDILHALPLSSETIQDFLTTKEEGSK